MPYTNKIYGMHWTLAFGLPLVVLVGLLLLASSAFSEVPPTPESLGLVPVPLEIGFDEATGITLLSDGTSITNTVTTAPWLMATMDSETGKLVLEKPPQWMLDGPKTNAPTQTTIRLTFYDRMDTNALYHFEYTTPARQAFLKGEVIEK